jgi:hypothetical protein
LENPLRNKISFFLINILFLFKKTQRQAYGRLLLGQPIGEHNKRSESNFRAVKMPIREDDFKDNPNPEWRDYVQRTSVLSIPRMFENFSSKINRVCWAFIFVGGITMTIYSEYQIVSTYLEYGAQISVHIRWR